MAGMKGRSGGARLGAGRKPKPRTIVTGGRDQTPLEFLLSVMNDDGAADKLRLEAAKTAARYVNPRKRRARPPEGRKPPSL